MDLIRSTVLQSCFLKEYLLKTSSPIDKMETYEEVITRLKFIGRIEQGVKMNVKHIPFVQPDGLITRLSRTFYDPENRGNTLNFITSTIRGAFELLSLHLNSTRPLDRIMCGNLAIDLKNSINGLNSLKRTYNSDLFFCSKLDTMIQEIDARMKELETSHPELLVVKKRELFESIEQPISPSGPKKMDTKK